MSLSAEMSVSAETKQTSEERLTQVITVGVDGTPAGDAALAWALDEAARRGDSVDAVSVWPYPTMGGDGIFVPVLASGGSEPSVRSDVEAALARVGYDRKVPVSIEPRFGTPGSVLAAQADAMSAELLVIGRSTRHLAHDLFVGSVTHAVCHQANRPVVVVSPPESAVTTATPRHHGWITVGVDGSDRSRAGLEWGLREAAIRQSSVRAVLIWDSVPRPFEEGTVTIVADSEATPDAQAAALVAAEVAAARRAVPEASAVSVTAVAVRGSARDLLVSEAAAADLLVLGDHPRTVLGEVMLGSTTRMCLRHATAPVVVVGR